MAPKVLILTHGDSSSFRPGGEALLLEQAAREGITPAEVAALPSSIELWQADGEIRSRIKLMPSSSVMPNCWRRLAE